MQFEKYQHLEKYGTVETAGINIGLCYVFPKIDGTNGSIWFDDETVKAGSRNRELSEENDNANFYKSIMTAENNKYYFMCKENPDCIFYGEWLVPHSLKTYQENAWNKFYIFDVMRNGQYLPYEEYKEICDKYGVDYIPALAKINNPTDSKIAEYVDKNDYLIPLGAGIGEGIVIKNYDYKNKFGRVTWAKIVSSEFKTKKRQAFGTPTDKEQEYVERKIVDKYVTPALIQKEYSKIAVDGFTSKQIPQLLNTVFYCLIKEESWNFLKYFKFPVVDYSTLRHYCIARIKEVMPQIF